MKTRIGLLIGGLGLILGSTASASTLPAPEDVCGGVGSAAGQVAFSQSVNGALGSASVSGGVGTITCTASFAVPAGDTLTGLIIEANDDAQQPATSSSEVSWTWTYTGGQGLTSVPSGVFSETSTGSTFGTCTGTGTLVCDNEATFNLSAHIISTTGFVTTGTISFTVSPSSLGGDNGVGPNGSDSAQILIQPIYTTPTSSTPEPAALLLIGSGFAALGVLARRKRPTINTGA
jgi:hypothetical protein